MAIRFVLAGESVQDKVVEIGLFRSTVGVLINANGHNIMLIEETGVVFYGRVGADCNLPLDSKGRVVVYGTELSADDDTRKLIEDLRRWIALELAEKHETGMKGGLIDRATDWLASH